MRVLPWKRRDPLARIGAAAGPLVSPDSASAASEAYRMLRTNLLVSRNDRGCILVTSPLNDEGKSITCANLGIVLSTNGHSVAILDADLRLPSQHRIFDIEQGTYADELEALPDAFGVSELPGWLERCAHEMSPTLTVIPAGTPPERPSELLGSPHFERLLNALCDGFDVVLIDSPPAAMVADAAILARATDAVLLVIDASRAHRRACLRAVRSLRNVGANILGAVLNKAPSRGFETTYGYGARADGS